MAPLLSFSGIRRYLRVGMGSDRRVAQREVDDELEAHVAMRVAHLVSRGVPVDVARREALRRFGDIDSARDALVASARRRNRRLEVRDWLGSVRQDAVGAVRQMRRLPGFAALNIATIALGIGLTTAVFATVDAVLLRPLPFPSPDRLVSMQGVDSVGNPVVVVSADNWYDWRRLNHAFSDVAIHWPARISVRSGDGAVRAPAELVSPGFFRVIQPRLLFGRTFADSGDALESSVVVSEGFWRTVLGARPPSGLHVVVDGVDRDVIGVVASGGEFPEGRDVWIPYRHHQRGGSARNAVNWLGIGRLAPGVSISAASADLATVARRIRDEDPVALYSYGVRLDPLQNRIVGEVSDYLRLLMGAVLLVLMIACANLASANLARGVSRSREMGVRAALGAGKRRVVRQLLVEHLCIAFIGGAGGTILAALFIRAISAAAASQLPRSGNIALDGRVLAFGILLATLTGLVTGLLPAWQASRTSPNAALGGGSRGNVQGGRGLPARLLVGGEVALALVLVTCAGLLVQSLRSVLSQPLGFDARGVVSAQVMLSGPAYATNQAAKMAYWRDLQTTLRSAPGVERVGLANWIPLEPGGSSFIEIAGKSIPGASAGYRVVGDDYFAALRVPVLSGRAIVATDDSMAPRVAVINRAMARRFWPDENPLGKLVRAPSMEGSAAAPWLTIVGVVGDVRQYGYEFEPTPELFVSYRQVPGWTYTLTAVIRGRVADAGFIDVVRKRVRDIDPAIAPEIDALDARAERRTSSRRFTMSVLAAFGGLALLLASIGVYGVLSFAVAQRTREIAVRSALGARQPTLVGLVLASGARVIAAGVAVGLAGSLILTKLIRSMLFNVSPTDPAVLVLSIATIATVALLAALIPAYRATRVDPIIALKAE